MTMSSRPLRRDAERNRQRVLDAAQRAFAERGVETTLEEVARAAGVGIGTVYRRFPSRDALVEAVFERQLGCLVRLSDEALAEPDPWTGLTGFLHTIAVDHLTDRGLREITLAPTSGEDRLSRVFAALVPPAERLLDRARTAGVVRPDVEIGDLVLAMLAVADVAEHTRHAPGRPWLRYHALVLEGLRATSADVPRSPLTEPDLNAAVRAWATTR
ncbi:TetR/AcrR family transcriptional regulator [Actinocorallia sp. API 0066]|uniref:TetR/AcrR family transcriptional regulator n=1 Tax=Actinocorallia sp. API 0066 TaxID=2896846 RepID=UPI001E4BE796|nr:TetR/AcrR family transcriptional regulator [Actinocorallia sp. API 0066]MCD0450794.1 TetR/AcrR family transcriptional regulator [Actinocorallia sp. API 0066]